MSERKRIRVLVVDDSAIVRKLLSEAISAEPDMEVVATAPDPYIAREKILALRPDVLTLDVEMPRMDGLTFLKKVMRYHPMPVIMISSLGQASCQVALDALRIGAVEVLAKPGGPYSVGELRTELAGKIRAAAAARLSPKKPPALGSPANFVSTALPAWIAASSFHPETVIAIGSSTGGTEALKQVLTQIPANAPPILIAQHIPPVFSKAFAGRMNTCCAVEVKEAADGDRVVSGRVLIAPGNFHMMLRRAADGYRVQIQTGPMVCYQRPSVDVLFCSVAEVAGASAVGVILTGMGSDGAQGMLRMKQSGAHTIAQDEASCVVFGMPREAIRIGAVDRTLPLSEIAAAALSGAAQAFSKDIFQSIAEPA